MGSTLSTFCKDFPIPQRKIFWTYKNLIVEVSRIVRQERVSQEMIHLLVGREPWGLKTN